MHEARAGQSTMSRLIHGRLLLQSAYRPSSWHIAMPFKGGVRSIDYRIGHRSAARARPDGDDLPDNLRPDRWLGSWPCRRREGEQYPDRNDPSRCNGRASVGGAVPATFGTGRDFVVTCRHSTSRMASASSEEMTTPQARAQSGCARRSERAIGHSRWD